MFDLARDTIFITLAGSQAHGTAREGSDVDLRGVCVAPLDVRVSLFQAFEQFEGVLDGVLGARIVPALERHPTAARGMAFKTEAVIFDISKFLRLCASANPNALEVLFADEGDWLHETPIWRRLAEKVRSYGIDTIEMSKAARKLQNVANELQARMLEAVKGTALPADVDHDFVEQMAFEIIRGG